ncbi:SufE family protein [Alienimonas chondri]|uniref:Cysteine desulfuration protein SufE n=1 Tax=Alienimonas chondri TaxID=2681879 RepID=A0ABX1VHB8_9PLAN|nr:SufE family protein [Alienimonas chondri]NNJ27199.1 Cysteine desulfuration protein SufE [Alienimonas chondri]
MSASPDTAASPVMTLDELREEFEFLGNWEDQCEFLIDVGMDLPKLPAEDKNEQTRVHGCQSLVWLTVDEADGRLKISAESDAMIVNGLIAVLLATFDRQTPEDALAVDVEEVFSSLGLDEHLSSARKSGLSGMVQRIRGEAARLRVEDAE